MRRQVGARRRRGVEVVIGPAVQRLAGVRGLADEVAVAQVLVDGAVLRRVAHDVVELVAVGTAREMRRRRLHGAEGVHHLVQHLVGVLAGELLRSEEVGAAALQVGKARMSADVRDVGRPRRIVRGPGARRGAQHREREVDEDQVVDAGAVGQTALDVGEHRVRRVVGDGMPQRHRLDVEEGAPAARSAVQAQRLVRGERHLRRRRLRVALDRRAEEPEAVSRRRRRRRRRP